VERTTIDISSVDCEEFVVSNFVDRPFVTFLQLSFFSLVVVV